MVNDSKKKKKKKEENKNNLLKNKLNKVQERINK